MLKNTALQHGMTIANDATSRGLSLNAMQGTPLAALAVTTACCETTDFNQNGPQALARASEPGQLKLHDHGHEEYEIAKNLRIFLENKTLRIIREEINPLIREIRGEINRRRVQIAEQNALGLDVVMHDVKSIYTSNFLEQLINNASLKRQALRGVTESLRSMLLADMSPEKIAEVMKTVSNEANVQLTELTLSDDYIYDTLLRAPERTDRLDIYRQHNDLLSFFFLRGVQNEQHPFVKLDSLTAEQRVDLAGAISAYQFSISQKLELISRNATNESPWLMVEGKTIHVLGSKYLQWIEAEANTKEAVFGALDRFKENAINVLREASEEELKNFENYYQHAVARTENKIRSTVDNVVDMVTEQMIVAHFHEEAKTSEVAQETLKDDVQTTREYFHHVRKEPLENEATFIARAVCRTVGKGIDAEMIIVEMQNYLEAEENQEADLSTALQYALGRLLGRYLARQTTIEKFNHGNFGAPTVATEEKTY